MSVSMPDCLPVWVQTQPTEQISLGAPSPPGARRPLDSPLPVAVNHPRVAVNHPLVAVNSPPPTRTPPLTTIPRRPPRPPSPLPLAILSSPIPRTVRTLS
eukprot:865986-Prorocentrum_minimum.AAC.1